MFPEMNKAIVLRWYEEGANQGKLAVADELFTNTYVDHDPPSPSEVWPRGAEGAKESLAVYRAAFPDLRFGIQHIFAEGEYVAVRYVFDGTHRGGFLGIQPTGKEIRLTGISMWRVLDQRIVESWAQFDLLDFIQQVGTWPQPDRPSEHTPGEETPVA